MQIIDETQFRIRLGSRLVLLSTLAVTALAVSLLIGAALSANPAFLQASNLVLASILPLFGTWVGTVLAFYFTKENFEAASQNTLKLVQSVQQRLSVAPIKSTMMPKEKIIVLQIPKGGKLGDTLGSDIAALFDRAGANGGKISRLPILNDTGKCIAFLHRGVWTEMLSLGMSDKLHPFVMTDRLETLLGLRYPLKPNLTFGDYISATMAFADVSGTVADAKAAMEAKTGCQDVIITEHGSPEEPVLGWLSNVDVLRLLDI